MGYAGCAEDIREKHIENADTVVGIPHMRKNGKAIGPPVCCCQPLYCNGWGLGSSCMVR